MWLSRKKQERDTPDKNKDAQKLMNKFIGAMHERGLRCYLNTENDKLMNYYHKNYDFQNIIWPESELKKKSPDQIETLSKFYGIDVKKKKNNGALIEELRAKLTKYGTKYEPANFPEYVQKHVILSFMLRSSPSAQK